MVDPANTASEAEAGKAVATSSDKAELQKLIDGNLLNSNLYKLSSLGKQWDYAGALQNAKEVNDSKTATVNVVKLAVWELTKAQKNLSGEKVKVASLGWIDNATAAKISSAASNAYPSNLFY